MNLIIFDIDGTIIDSVGLDDECYIQSINSLFDIPFSNVDWNTFTHVTDSGITEELIQKHYGRSPSEEELIQIKSKYAELLSAQSSRIKPIPGAEKFINHLLKQEDWSIAFATGAWKKLALIKTSTLNIDIDDHVLKTADDHVSREKIVQAAIEGSMRQSVNHFNRIISIGDGLWDYQTAKNLNVEFIGVDVSRKGHFEKVGHQHIIYDYSAIEFLIKN